MTVPSVADERDRLVQGFARALDVDADDALVRYVTKGQGKLTGRSVQLLRWDANSIHSFVFDTTNATGIRGASDVLKRMDELLERETKKRLGIKRHQILYSGGGSGLAVVSDHQIEPVSRRLHAFFAEETRIATCSVATVPLVSGDGGFKERAQAVDRALARNRLLTGPDAEPLVAFFAQRCEVCGRRAASRWTPRGVNSEKRHECEPCWSRIEKGKANVRFQKEPTDYELIADDVKGGFFAVLYLDGNGIGRTILNLESPLDYAAFSQTIAEVVGGSFRTVARRYRLTEDANGEGEAKPRGGSYQLPISGGDDLVAILPGDVAVPLARNLLQEIERAADAEPLFRHLKVKNLGASAGVAIGHGKFPIRHLLAESEALLRSAKGRVYAEKRPHHRPARSALDFAVVTDGSPRSETVEPERWTTKPDTLLQSGRPYSLEEFLTFSERFKVVRSSERKIGRTQLFSLRAYAQSGRAQLRNHLLYQVGRREGWRHLVRRLAGRDSPDSDADVARDKERCADQIAPEYGKFRIFDVGDMIALYDHWREPEEKGDS